MSSFLDGFISDQEDLIDDCEDENKIIKYENNDNNNKNIDKDYDEKDVIIMTLLKELSIYDKNKYDNGAV